MKARNILESSQTFLVMSLRRKRNFSVVERKCFPPRGRCRQTASPWGNLWPPSFPTTNMAPTSKLNESIEIQVHNRTKYKINLITTSNASSICSSPSISLSPALARSLSIPTNFVVQRSISFQIQLGNVDSKDSTSNSTSTFSFRVLNSSQLSSSNLTSTPDSTYSISYFPISLPSILSSQIYILQSLPSSTSNFPPSILIFPIRSTSNFLSTLPSTLPISALSLPGTHESLARYGWPVSSCQSSESNVLNQLNSGIRYFDVRMSPKGEGDQMKLFAYHGITDQRIRLDEVLEDFYRWLDGDGKDGKCKVCFAISGAVCFTDPFLSLSLFFRFLNLFLITYRIHPSISQTGIRTKPSNLRQSPLNSLHQAQHFQMVSLINHTHPLISSR